MNIAPVAEGVSVFGINFNGLTIIFKGFIKYIQTLIYDPPVEIRVGIIRVDRDRFIVIIDRLRILPF